MNAEDTKYRSLDSALKDWYDKPLAEYPDNLRKWIELGLGVGLNVEQMQAWWDNKSPAARIAYAKQWDYQHDPTTKESRDDLDKFYDDLENVEREISEWKNVGTPTALDLAIQKKNLNPLRAQLRAMDSKRRQMRGDLEAEDSANTGQIKGPADTNQKKVTAPKQVGRPKILEKKAYILRSLIECMTKAEGLNSDYLPGSASDLLDACRRIEKAKVGKCRVFSTSDATFKTWLKSTSYGFKTGRPPKDEARYWTQLCVKTMGLIGDDIFTGVFDKAEP